MAERPSAEYVAHGGGCPCSDPTGPHVGFERGEPLLVEPETPAVRTELRALRTILRQAEKLSPASRRWLIERLHNDGLAGHSGPETTNNG